jgi:hypothetical protein
MTTKEELVKQKLKTKVFDVIGKSVTFKSRDTPTYDDRGDYTSPSFTESTITIVPYNIMESRESFEEFGTLQEGSMDIAIPYDITVKKEDHIIIESTEYSIDEIMRNYLPGNVVTIARITKVQ